MLRLANLIAVALAAWVAVAPPPALADPPAVAGVQIFHL